MAGSDYTVVVIGTGFGGTMTALPIARHFRDQVKQGGPKRTVFMLERGTWWTTPLSTVQDKAVATYDFLERDKRQRGFLPQPVPTAKHIPVRGGAHRPDDVCGGRGSRGGKGSVQTGPGARCDHAARTARRRKALWNDPVYTDIKQSIDRLAQLFADPADPQPFINPFLTKSVFGTLKMHSITLSHPLGGCRIAPDGHAGVVDEYGHVFDVSTPAARGIHKGLYIADGSIVPTALGVNPSLTITALSLRIASNVIKDLDAAERPR